MDASDALKTDLYELTMAAGYYENKVRLRAVFELFCYRPLPHRSYFVNCGTEQVAEYLLNLRFSRQDIDFLRAHPALRSASKEFFDYLKGFKFTGDVWAMPEGEIFFPLEPILQIEAPIIEAQIVETFVLSTMHIQSLVATKASRIVKAACADGLRRDVVDFGSRRAHGPDAAVLAARAAYIGGCAGTSNVYAGRQFGIPIYGTMAHSWVEAFESEREAFIKFYETFPEHTVMLIDTYDTIKAARKVAELDGGIKGVRIDSGDLDASSRRVRKILDGSGLKEAKIVVSGNLNEYRIIKLVRNKAPIDIFGVGTEMVTSGDMPSLDLIYKLVQTRSGSKKVSLKAKTSKGKATLPGRKQVYRVYGSDGVCQKDVICHFAERAPGNSRALLAPIIRKGRLVKEPPLINDIRRSLQEKMRFLPDYCTKIAGGQYLRTELSHHLMRLKRKICRKD